MGPKPGLVELRDAGEVFDAAGGVARAPLDLCGAEQQRRTREEREVVNR